MNIEEVKKIPLEDFLGRAGFSPVRRQGDSVWYLSPFRQERTPSFKVSLSLNLWHDFGEGTGGSIIDLAQKLYGVTDIPTVLQRIGSDFPAFRPVPSPAKGRTVASAFEELRVSPLKNTVLLDYLGTRGIPSDIASRECVEVHYRMRGKWYFAVGFKNRKGGIEIRNPYFKGAVSPKDITHVSHNAVDRRQSSVLVFEGFMDYLSYLALKEGQAVPDCVVLNSVANLPKAVDILKSYGQVCCFLDNDETGRKAVEEIGRLCEKVTDKAVHYLPHKDLNEFLQERVRSGWMSVRQKAKTREGWKRGRQL